MIGESIMVEFLDSIAFAVSTALMFIGLAIMAVVAWQLVNR